MNTQDTKTKPNKNYKSITLDYSFILAALYLFLLIFFILLSTTYKPSKNFREQLLNSISKKFTGRNIKIEEYFIPEAYKKRKEIYDFYAMYINTIGNDQKITPPKSMNYQTLPTISTPINYIFTEDTTNLTIESSNFFAKIIDLMHREIDDTTIAITISISNKNFLETNYNTDLLISRLEALRNKLVAHNVSNYNITVQVHNLGTSEISFGFNII